MSERTCLLARGLDKPLTEVLYRYWFPGLWMKQKGLIRIGVGTDSSGCKESEEDDDAIADFNKLSTTLLVR